MSWSIFARCSASCASRALRFSRAAATTDGFRPRRAGDLEREAAAGRSVEQLVGRRERLGVEAERRARDALRRRRVRLQRVVVARRDRPSRRGGGSDRRSATPSAPPSIGSVPEPTSSSSTSAGVASAAIHRRDVGDVRRERAQARVDRLLVADVGEDRSEHRQPRSVGGRNPQAGLRHQREQPGGLERDGLAAGVRTGDEQAPSPAESILIVTGTGVLQQRMPRRLQLERAVGRQRRLDAVDRLREARARLQHVELGRRLDRPLQVGRARAERVGQRQQNPPDFFGFLLLERDDVVVDLDGAERLEKQARAARRRAVHDAGNRRCGARP